MVNAVRESIKFIRFNKSKVLSHFIFVPFEVLNNCAQLGSSIAHVVSKHFGEDGKAIRGKWKKLYPWQSFPKIEILFADVVCGT